MARENSTSVLAFIRAFGVRWFVLMSGPLTVPFTGAALFIENKWLKTLFGLFAATCAAFACYWIWRHERKQTIVLNGRVVELEGRLKPRLIFVRQECCSRHASLGLVGVANPNPVSVEDARVYLTVPALQLDDIVVNWAGMGIDEGLDIHQASVARHHHTGAFLSVGDNPGHFYVHPAYGPPHRIDAGKYLEEPCVKGRNVTAATARVEFIFAQPRSLSMRLVSEGQD